MSMTHTLVAVPFVVATIATAPKVPTFDALTKSYPTKCHPCDQKELENQCAIRLSIAINATNTFTIDKGAYFEPTCKHGHARGARELATWLRSRERLAEPVEYSVKNTPSIESTLKGKKGIVFVKNCFTRSDGTIGSHIDLWDGQQMKSQTVCNGTVTNSLFQQGEEVWLWTLKN